MLDRNPNANTDEQLSSWLCAVAGGDRDAFEALYRATSPRLFGVCLHFLSDRSDAEDVLQDAYANIWSKSRQFDPVRSTAGAWLAMIARNKAIDRLRTLPRTRVAADAGAIDAAFDDDAQPDRTAEAADERAQLDRCLEQLDARRRGLIRTAFFEGATYDELATRSKSPLGSVKSWIRRGLAQLRECLEG